MEIAGLGADHKRQESSWHNGHNTLPTRPWRLLRQLFAVLESVAPIDSQLAQIRSRLASIDCGFRVSIRLLLFNGSVNQNQ
jgi:hypothetical protein